MRYKYYSKCDKCGGDYESSYGATLDSYPASYPVKCKECEDKSTSFLLHETLNMGWKKPDWLKDEDS